MWVVEPYFVTVKWFIEWVIRSAAQNNAAEEDPTPARVPVVNRRGGYFAFQHGADATTQR